MIREKEIARLRELEAKATPGPWCRSGPYSKRLVRKEGFPIATFGAIESEGHEDAEMVVALRNAAPALLAAAERAVIYEEALGEIEVNTPAHGVLYAVKRAGMALARAREVRMAEEITRHEVQALLADCAQVTYVYFADPDAAMPYQIRPVSDITRALRAALRDVERRERIEEVKENAKRMFEAQAALPHDLTKGPQ